MATSTKPRNPVENWEAVRDEWVAEVERFVSVAESWAHRQDWGTLRDPKEIDEDRLGVYTVPRLLVHAIFGRFLIDPICRYVVGATGRIEICVIPSFDSLAIARDDDGQWHLHTESKGRLRRRPWSEEVFVETIHQLARKA